VAEKLGIDLVWFGVLLAVNMQTSFMHPPFGFALFYLRSVAPTDDYHDRITKKPVAKVTTGQIYWGAVPFVVIQVIMVGLIIAFPGLVSGGLAKKADVDLNSIQIDAPPPKDSAKDNKEMDAGKLMGIEPTAPAGGASGGASGSESAPAPASSKEEDPMEAIKRALEEDKARKP
jgi:GntP family gluconate:H+ symporter